ncbi:MAG TPA: hypothetical protein VLR88_10215 [Propionibacteriaceae bacterium]|nr:hypothetical protein [Propionibacteriaceae bacterium]
MRVFSDLNLNGRTPPRVQPKVGEWGPEKVPTTASKKRMRIWVSLAFVGSVIALCLLGYYYFTILSGV